MKMLAPREEEDIGSQSEDVQQPRKNNSLEV